MPQPVAVEFASGTGQPRRGAGRDASSENAARGQVESGRLQGAATVSNFDYFLC